MKQVLAKIISPSRGISKGEFILARAPFALLLLQVLLLFSERRLLWGVDNLFYRFGHADDFLSNAILRLYYAPELSGWILTVHILCCVLALLSVPVAVLPRMGAWLTALMLYAAAPTAYFQFMPLLLTMSFASIGLCLHTPFFERIHVRYWLHVLMRAQSVLFACAFACFAWGTEQWLQGQTFYYAIHQDAMIRPWVLQQQEILGSMSAGFTYTLMVFATLFPLLMMIRSMRIKGIYVGALIVIAHALLFNHVLNSLTLALLLLPWGIDLPGSKQQVSRELEER
jgi:hypothetical protein